MQELAFYPVVIGHYHGDKTLFIHPQQVKAGDGKLFFPRRQRIYRVLRKMGNHLPRPGQYPIQFLQLHLQGPVDALSFLHR